METTEFAPLQAEPAWDVARLFPAQGHWSEEEYFKLAVMFAPMRVRLASGKYREPDILMLLEAHLNLRMEQYWLGADLVMEVVSPDDRKRDYVTKRREYAEAGIPKYRIVDPETRLITVLVLGDGAYDLYGEFAAGSRADSQLLSGFNVSVTDLFAELDK